MSYAYTNFGLPAPPAPVADDMNRFSHRSSIPCPDCAAEGKQIYMMQDPYTEEWMCPECHCNAWDNEPWDNIDDIFDAFLARTLEVVNAHH